jgi:hypothetical protein
VYEGLIRNLWSAGLLLLSILVGILVCKKTWRTFPLFTTYCISTLVTNLGMFMLRDSPKAYFYTYWPSEALSIGLNLAVMYEVFRQLFSPYPALTRMAWRTLRASLFVLLALALIILLTTASSERWKVIGAALFTTEEAMRVVELGIVGFLFIFSRTFQLHWRQPVFGIVLGFGVFASAEVIATAGWVHVQDSQIGLLSVVRMCAFDVAVIIWGTYMLVRETVRMSTAPVPTRPELERMERALRRIIYQ